MNETVIKERPILFSAPMVRAILEGRKTQTRRVMKDQSEFKACEFEGGSWWWKFRAGESGALVMQNDRFDVGDHLWVRETCFIDAVLPNGLKRCFYPDSRDVLFSDGTRGTTPHAACPYEIMKHGTQKLTVSIHQPRWASRITLEVTKVRVQRIQEMTMFDLDAEGVPYDPAKGLSGNKDRLAWFIALWEKLNKPRGFDWESNPWVWAITFKRVEK